MRTLVIAGMVCLGANFAALTRADFTPEILLPSHNDTSAFAPVMAYGNGVFLVVWEAGRNENADLVGVRLDKNGRLLDARPFVISGAKDLQSHPYVAFGRENFLVVWQDLRNGKDWDIYATRVTPAGKALDPDGVLVAGGPLDQSAPAACFDGRHFQLLWANQLRAPSVEKAVLNRGETHIFGRRLSLGGQPLEEAITVAQPIRLGVHASPGIGVPRMIRTSDGAVLAGAQSGHAHMPFWRMGEGKATGAVTTAFSNFLSGPRFATDGRNVLAVWSTFIVSPGRTSGTRGTGLLFLPEGDAARVDKADMGAGEPRRHPGRSLSEGLQQVRNPVVAWNGKEYLAAWDITKRTEHRFDVVWFRRISATGEPEGKDELVAGEISSPARHPALASDGSRMTVLAYERHFKDADTPVKIGVRLSR